MKICERCNKEHDGKYASGRFCSRSCANIRIISQEQKESARLFHKILNDYVCITCGTSFSGKIRSDRLIKCKNCRKERVVKENVKSILEYSKRTVAKIIKRAKLKCAMCGWDETSLDVHHIIERKNGGTNDMDNLIAICPNCHRKAHEKKYTKEQLKERALDKTLLDWENLYATR
jgi:DNA-directed RNA polymerase subunit RPC12/RpoP